MNDDTAAPSTKPQLPTSERHPYSPPTMEPASEDEIMAQLRTWDLAAEPISADPADRARELALLSRAVSTVKSRGDLELVAKIEARMSALELHPGGPPAARRPSIATRVETFLRQESQQRGTSWMVVATVLAILLAALAIFGAGFR
jgi:hypothetical protein